MSRNPQAPQSYYEPCLQVWTLSWDPDQPVRPRHVLGTTRLPGHRWQEPSTGLPCLRCLGPALPACTTQVPSEERTGRRGWGEPVSSLTI